MDYRDWIRKDFKVVAQKLGFIFTPREEIENRLSRVKEVMRRKGIEALLVIQKIDYYYLSGTTQNALLFVPVDGAPLLLVRKEMERAKLESPIPNVADLKSLRDLPALIKNHCGQLPRSLGVEFDVLPVKDYFRYRELFPESQIVDSSAVFREVRRIKSPFEIHLMRKAGSIGKEIYEYARKILRRGITEIEWGGLLESVAKKSGHEGILRVRSLNYEAYSWHVLSGFTGGIVSQSDSPMGGLGLSPAFPVGASRKTMDAHEPILLDFGVCYHGYQVDQTRMFSIGKMKQKFIEAYKACREIHDLALEETRPGTNCEELFTKTLKLANKLGYEESYLGPPGLQTRFIGHGIGLELNELPCLAPGHAYPLEEGMTFAVEPKMVFPGEGAVGLENTVVVTKKGYEILTPIDLTIFQV